MPQQHIGRQPVEDAEGFWEREAEALTHNATERRRQAPIRLMISLFSCLVGLALLGQPRLNSLLMLWLAVALVVQALEVAALWRFRLGRPLPGPVAVLVSLFATGLISAVFAGCTLFLWVKPGALGPIMAVMIIANYMVNVTMLCRGSMLALAAAGAPHLAFMLAAPFLMRTEMIRDPLFPTMLMAGFVFALSLVISARHMERLRTKSEASLRLAEQRSAQAEAATEAKSRYSAAISHELRTPLTAIMAAADVLAARLTDTRDADTARMVGEAGRMMRRLLDDLLDLAKMEAGRMDVEVVAFSPCALLEESRRLWAAEAAGSALQLELEGAADLPTTVMGDPGRLRQVLNNLVSNAVKFTAAGVVRLSAAAEPLGKDAWRLFITVSDTGCGLDTAQQSRLFIPFEQAHAAGAAQGGTGLGLTVSRELARLMGGDLTVESSPAGSRFTVSVVLIAAAHNVTAAAPPAPEPLNVASLAIAHAAAGPGEPSADLRLLVVDDQPLVRQAIAVLLEAVGVTARYAATAGEAEHALSTEPFDLVLMDVNLADMDGRDVARAVRGRPGPNRSTPILAVTGAVQDGAHESYLASGMNGFIAKPLEARRFYAALGEAFDARASSDNMAA